MNTPQFIGMGVTTAVVLGVDLTLDWLIPLAMICGGLATYFVTLWQRQRS